VLDKLVLLAIRPRILPTLRKGFGTARPPAFTTPFSTPLVKGTEEGEGWLLILRSRHAARRSRPRGPRSAARTGHCAPSPFLSFPGAVVRAVDSAPIRARVCFWRKNREEEDSRGEPTRQRQRQRVRTCARVVEWQTGGATTSAPAHV
jgi:hypothetical protein